MKKIIFLICVSITIWFSQTTATAQEKQTAKVSRLQQDGDMVYLTITSPNEFYVGGNVHMLFIGSKHFIRNEQNNIEGKGILKYFIPANEYKALEDGSAIFLTYGDMGTEDAQELEALSKEDYTPCWSLGKLNKKMLK
jgi:hypothetical protein